MALLRVSVIMKRYLCARTGVVALCLDGTFVTVTRLCCFADFGQVGVTCTLLDHTYPIINSHPVALKYIGYKWYPGGEFSVPLCEEGQPICSSSSCVHCNILVCIENLRVCRTSLSLQVIRLVLLACVDEFVGAFTHLFQQIHSTALAQFQVFSAQN